MGKGQYLCKPSEVRLPKIYGFQFRFPILAEGETPLNAGLLFVRQSPPAGGSWTNREDLSSRYRLIRQMTDAFTQLLFIFRQRRRDSNSREVATTHFLPKIYFPQGGEGGIRTLDTLRYTRFLPTIIFF